jgi:multiple sugar transport system substrate-binding protein
MRSLIQTLHRCLVNLRQVLVKQYLLKQGLMICLLVISSGVLAGCTAPPPAPQVTHLTLWHGVNPAPNRDVLQNLVNQFNRTHPTIQVDPQYIGQADQQLPKLLAAVVGNAAPDMLWYAAMLTGRLVDLDAIRPLDDWLPTIPEAQALDPALVETMQLEGKTWSIPFATNNVGVFYRPSLFKAAGITALPKTWVELRQVARQLTRDSNGDGRPDQYGMVLPLGKGEWSVFTWLPFLWGGGGELVEIPQVQALAKGTVIYGNNVVSGTVVPRGPDNDRPQSQGKIQLTNPGAIAALQFWQDLITDGSATLSAPERGYEMDGFLSGKVAMQISGPWTLRDLQQSGKDFAAFPIPQGSRPATTIGGENLFVFKSTPQREQAALQFAQFVLSEEFQTAWATQTGYLPVNLKSRESSEYKAFRASHPVVDVFLQQAKYGRSRPIFPGYNRISENLGRAIEGTLLRQGSPQQILTEAQKRLDLIFN